MIGVETVKLLRIPANFCRFGQIRVGAEVKPLSLSFDANHPFATLLVPINSIDPTVRTSFAFPQSEVPAVFDVVDHSQVAQPVVASVPIYVINHTVRPIAVAQRPSDPMSSERKGSVVAFKVATILATERFRPQCFIASGGFAMYFPRFRVVGELSPKFFCADAFSIANSLHKFSLFL